MGQLVIVSNRVAIPERIAKARAGGLEVAVKAALKHKTGIWFGWSGKVATHTKIATRKVVHDKITYITLDLSKEDHHEYYNGFTNRVLWPILHYRIDLAEFSRRDLSGYLRVNDHFARELHEVLGPDDIIWVHDYHLMPLAKALRERGHKNRIGFFLHIPCPPPEILTALPHHERLIPSLCEYDLVGVQTGDDAFNFSRYLARECGLHSRDFNFVVADRIIRIDVFPVGIETAAFADLAQRSVSRTEIPEYAEIEQEIGSAAGRINGAFGEADWTPIRYVNRPYSHSTLAGLYRAARVGLVTPLRDGMNLVAKEYVASQNPDDPGVLILSRFAGASHEFKAALLVNPYDPDSVAAAIGQALAMPLAERRERHDSLFRVLAHNDIQHWADRFLTALERRPRAFQLSFVTELGGSGAKTLKSS